jgi:hypothetical protein
VCEWVSWLSWLTDEIYKIIGDTVLHSWEVLASILSSDKTTDILCDIGMCVKLHSSFSYI